jgi:predicted porin
MQKKLIAIVVAAAFAPAVAAADTGNVNVYGRLHASIDSIDNGNNTQNSSTFVNTNSSRFGVRGSEDLGGGLSAIFQVESNVNLTGTGIGGNGGGTNATPNTSNSGNYGAFGGQVRDTFVGLSGGLGKIQIGRLAQENHWVYEMNLFADQAGDLGIMTSPIGGRSDGEVLYTTPTFQGFTGNVQFYPASSHAGDQAVGSTGAYKNGYGVKLNYNAMGVNASFNYLNRNDSATALYTPAVFSVSYDFGAGLIGGQYMRDRREGIGAVSDQSTKRNIFNVGGLYRVTPAVSVKAHFVKAGDVTGNNGLGSTSGKMNVSGTETGSRMTAMGVDYAFSKRTTAYLSYARTDNDANTNYNVVGNGHNNQMSTVTNGRDPRAFTAGLTHNF